MAGSQALASCASDSSGSCKRIKRYCYWRLRSSVHGFSCNGRVSRSKGADNIRLILRNLTQLTNNLAQLRGLYGTGHGRDGQHRGLQPRHARLAVASAVAFIDFVAETYAQRQSLRSVGTLGKAG